MERDLQPLENNPKLILAPVMDRFLARAFDAIIFSSIIGIILAPLFRRINFVAMTSQQTDELAILISLAGFYIASLVIILNTCFLIWKKASVGQIIFKIQVVNIEDPNRRLGFSESFLRSCFWVLEFFLLMFPFLEVFSRDQRRALHDRVAGTVVVTLKSVGDPEPTLIEKQVVGKVILTSYLTLGFWGLLVVSQFYFKAMNGEYKATQHSDKEKKCAKVTSAFEGRGKSESFSSQQRLDQALAMFSAGLIDSDCVNQEADYVLWDQQESALDWAYFAKGYVIDHDSKKKKEYFEKACSENHKAVPCQIAQRLSELKNKSTPYFIVGELSENALGTQIAQVWRGQDYFQKADYRLAEESYLALSEFPAFRPYSHKGLVQSLWAQDKKREAEGAFQILRTPGSIEETQDLAAWLCLQQVSEQCNSSSRSACQSMNAYYENSFRQVETAVEAVAILRNQQCRNSSEIEIGRMHELFKKYPDLLKLAKAISAEQKYNLSQRLDLARELAFRHEPVRPVIVREQALIYLAENSNRKTDIEVIAKYLERKKIQDLTSKHLRSLVSAERLPAQAEVQE